MLERRKDDLNYKHLKESLDEFKEHTAKHLDELKEESVNVRKHLGDVRTGMVELIARFDYQDSKITMFGENTKGLDTELRKLRDNVRDNTSIRKVSLWALGVLYMGLTAAIISKWVKLW